MVVGVGAGWGAGTPWDNWREAHALGAGGVRVGSMVVCVWVEGAGTIGLRDACVCVRVCVHARGCWGVCGVGGLIDGCEEPLLLSCIKM